MQTIAEIESLSDNKLDVADYLMTGKHCDTAYYIAGYAFELLLKAKICKTLVIPDFFDFDNASRRKLPDNRKQKKSPTDIYKPFKNHDYEQLLILSGLYLEFLNKLSDLSFKADWSIVSTWSEELRYSQGVSEKDTQSFIQSIKNLVQWLKQYLQTI